MGRSSSGIPYDSDGNPIIRTRHYNSPPGMSGGGGSRKRGEAVNDELAVEFSATGIYYINEKGEKVWFADINTSASMPNITKFWMDPESALEYFIEKYSEMDSYIKAEKLTAYLAGAEIFILGQVFSANAATLATFGLGAAGIFSNTWSETSMDVYNFMSHSTYSAEGIIAVYITVPIFSHGSGSVGILRVRNYYLIGGGLLGRVTLNN